MGEEDFFHYREILDWFHYQCYFNIENVAQCRDEAERLQDDEKITPEMAETLIYATRTSLTFKGRRNLLSLTSPEWLALIGNADIGGRLVEVKSADGFLDEGTPVIVVRVEDAQITVKKK